MNMPRFNAEFALSEPARSHRPASVLEAATDKTVVSPPADADSSGCAGLHVFSAVHIWAADKPNLLCRILFPTAFFRPVLFPDLLHPDGPTLPNVTGPKHTFLLNIR